MGRAERSEMSKIKDMTAACAGTAFGIVLFLYTRAQRWIPVLLHVFTAYIIWQAHGIIFGLFALFCPVVAEVYTFIRVWIAIGFLNYYTLAVAVVIGLYALPYLIFLLVAKSQKE